MVKHIFSESVEKYFNFLIKEYGFEYEFKDQYVVQLKTLHFFVFIFFVGNELSCSLGSLDLFPGAPPYQFRLDEVIYFLNPKDLKKTFYRIDNEKMLLNGLASISQTIKQYGDKIFNTDTVFRQIYENKEKKRSNIVHCSEGIKDGEPLKTLREVGFERILGREIIAWSEYLGSYGMGGPGFFGVKLGKKGDFSEEWLVLILWGAIDWLILDGKSLRTIKDEIPIKIVGARIIETVIKQKSTVLFIKKDSKKYKLEIPENKMLLPKYQGTLKSRVWKGNEHQLDAWVISLSGNLKTT